jgi:hypothetical protein
VSLTVSGDGPSPGAEGVGFSLPRSDGSLPSLEQVC